jgi:hypothetical protein
MSSCGVPLACENSRRRWVRTAGPTLETTLTRRIVTGHTLVAFAFNTVIIALLIAVLFLGHN